MIPIGFRSLSNLHLEQYLKATNRFRSVSKNQSATLPENSPINNYLSNSLTTLSSNSQIDNSSSQSIAIAAGYAENSLLRINTSLTELSSITNQASKTPNTSTLNELNNNYSQIFDQITEIVQNSTYKGNNFLLGSQAIITDFTQSQITIEGISIYQNKGLFLSIDNEIHQLSSLSTAEKQSDFLGLQRNIFDFKNLIAQQQERFKNTYETLSVENDYTNSINNKNAIELSANIATQVSQKVLSLSSYTTQSHIRKLL